MSSNVFLGSLAFLLFFSFVVAEITGTTFSFISPITLAISTGALVGVITASNTPVLKGASMAILFGDIIFHFVFLDIPPVMLFLVITPIFITLGLSMAEIGQG